MTEPGYLDHLVAEGLLPPEFLGRRRIDDIMAARNARMAATAEPEPTPEPDPEPAPELPPAVDLLPSSDAIGTLAAKWISDPDQAPELVHHQARMLHHHAKALLMQDLELPDLPDPPSTEEPQPEHHEDIDDADP